MRPPSVEEVEVDGPEALDERLKTASAPFVVRGLVSDWPLVEAGKQSAKHARDYLLNRRRDRKFTVSVAPASGDDRLFYDSEMQMNFRSYRVRLPEIFAQIDLVEGRADAPLVYLGSIDMQEFFEGLYEENHVDLGERNCLSNIWMGNRTRISAHNDLPDNLACVALGRRRFTLFPREQFRNLYLGPMDNTPAGRVISMVDFKNPDFERFPLFRDAMQHAVGAELEPGDALYIPALWWHHVESLDDFNILVNFWWRQTPNWMGQPQDALNLALMAIRDLPEDERRHWKEMFDYYVFNFDASSTKHIPESARSILAPLTPETAGRIRAFLLRQLSQ